jgi:hypothetical protein
MKGKSIVEVFIVFAVTSALSWWLNAQLKPLNLDFEVQRWISGAIFIALSLIIMALTRQPWREYGLTLKDWRLSFDIGMTGYVARFIPVGVLFALVLLDENYRWSWPGSVILLIAGIAGIWLLLTMLKRQDAKDPSGDARRSKVQRHSARRLVITPDRAQHHHGARDAVGNLDRVVAVDRLGLRGGDSLSGLLPIARESGIR